jgi:hypothetical protein
MATINLSWTPVNDANSNGQKVQRKSGAGSFADISSVLSASASNYSDTTALDNVLYTYQIVNLCEVGGPTDSGDVQAGKAVCPTVGELVAGRNVTLTFPNLTGDAMYSGDILVDTLDPINIAEGPTGTTVEFTGDYGVTYNYSFVISVGSNVANCSGSVTINDAPACPAPTNLSATVA